MGTAMTAIGTVAIAVALKLTVMATTADAREAELARTLAFDDAKNYLLNSANFMEQGTINGETAITGATMALDQLAGAHFALLRSCSSGGRELEAVGALRKRVTELIANGGDAMRCAEIARRLAEAIESGNGDEVGRLADELGNMGGDNKTDIFDRGFGALRHSAVMTEGALHEHAASFFGTNTVLRVADGVAFPPLLTLCGKNLMVTVSRARGQLLELYFDRPAGEVRLNEKECAEVAAEYAEKAGIDKSTATALVCTKKDELCGGWIFADKDNRVVIGVRHDSGRIFYFNAYGYYK